MNLDPVPPVRPLLTHVIVDEPLQREAGIKGDVRASGDSGVHKAANSFSIGDLAHVGFLRGVRRTVLLAEGYGR